VDLSTLLELTLTFFIVANPIGNSPAMITLVKDFDFKRQKIILFRESLFAMFIALFFQYFGKLFLDSLNIHQFAVTIAGGILLGYVAFSMIFSKEQSETSISKSRIEPFLVPIATPLISGPGLLAIIMFNSNIYQNNMEITLAIIIAFTGVIIILSAAPYFNQLLGKRGLAALEQIMGMILLMISFQMLVKGLNEFIKDIHP
jgi:multiple antibiotic resistance protein